MAIPENDILTVDEAAKFLRLKKTKTYELVKVGVIPSFRLGRSIRIPREDLLKLARSTTPKGGS